jgi:hypothetical protein
MDFSSAQSRRRPGLVDQEALLVRNIDKLVAKALRLADGVTELTDGLSRLPALAAADPEAALMRVRKLLEFVIHDLYQRRIAEPAGSRPLENLLQRMAKENQLPRKLGASANFLRELGNIGAHVFGESVSAADVEGALAHLIPILAWYRDEVGPRPAQPSVVPALVPAPTVPRRAEPSVPRRAWGRRLFAWTLVLCAAGAVGIPFLLRPGRPAEPAWRDGLAASPALRVLLEDQPEGNQGGEQTLLGIKIMARRGGTKLTSALADGARLTSADTYHIEVDACTSGFLYVFQVDTRGTLNVLHPTLDGSPYSTGSNPVGAPTLVRVPPDAELKLDDSVGVDHVFCVLSGRRWIQLERALVEADARAASPGAVVDSPFPVRTRGVGGLVPADVAASAATNEDTLKRYQGGLGFIVVGRWFWHDAWR